MMLIENLTWFQNIIIIIGVCISWNIIYVSIRTTIALIIKTIQKKKLKESFITKDEQEQQK